MIGFARPVVAAMVLTIKVFNNSSSQILGGHR